MDRRQVELHRSIRSRMFVVERWEMPPELANARRYVDAAIAKLSVGDPRNEVQRRLNYERTFFPLFLPAPQWLKDIGEQLQVIHGDSPLDDPNANAVHAIRLILGRNITDQKKLVAIEKIIGDVK